MKILYSPYILTPLKKANRLSSTELKEGVYLKGLLNRKVLFADYFPHEALGDRSVDQFLSEFKFQQIEYDRKVFDLLLKDHELQKFTPKPFLNHQLWSPGEVLEAPVIKYKVQDKGDYAFLAALKKGKILRLDTNGLFTKPEFEKFLKGIPANLISQIEYVEDPLSEVNWDLIGVPAAKDFIGGSPHDYVIYKPNCEFLPETDKKVIYSSYMGQDLGRWHAYTELIQHGNLSYTHGLNTPGLYQGQLEFFNGTYQGGFKVDQAIVKKNYHNVFNHDWKLLCSM